MRVYLVLLISCFVCLNIAMGNETPLENETDQSLEQKTRHFQLSLSATITDLPADASVHIWMPVPSNSNEQQIEITSLSFPAPVTRHQEETFGNEMIHCVAQPDEAGQLELNAQINVQRQEVQGLEQQETASLDDARMKRALAADRLVPIEGRPQQLLLSEVSLPESDLEKAKLLYESVEKFMTYDKSQPGYGNGDVLWACDSRTGNCTDFHSLFISLARSQKIPAEFEIGFPLPPERGQGKIGGYHCWAKFFVEGKGWIPVDISEADKHPEMKAYYFGNLTENRVTMTRGRDLILSPPQTGEPLNYFVFPYVEVDGKPWPKEKIELTISYQDLDSEK